MASSQPPRPPPVDICRLLTVPSDCCFDRDGVALLAPGVPAAFLDVGLPPPPSDVLGPPLPPWAWSAEGRADARPAADSVQRPPDVARAPALLAGAAGSSLPRRPSPPQADGAGVPPLPPAVLQRTVRDPACGADDDSSVSSDSDPPPAAALRPPAAASAATAAADAPATTLQPSPPAVEVAEWFREDGEAAMTNFSTESDHVVVSLINSPFSGRPATVWFRPCDFDSLKERRPGVPPVLRDVFGKPDAGAYGAVGVSRLRVARKKRTRLVYVHLGEGAVRFRGILATFQGAGLRLASSLAGNWNLLWAKRLQQEDWQRLGRHQRANHFPGTWGIGRKDSLSRSVAAMLKKFGPEHYGFHPRTYVLPGDAWLLGAEFDERSRRSQKKGPTFILKPLAAACGKGIRLVNRMPPPHRIRPCVAQRYVEDPMLINGCKFDLRIYVVVTCFNPLRIYVYREGMTRFATEPYPGGGSKIRNRFAHLTNYCINKESDKFVEGQVDDDAEGDAPPTDGDAGSKWTLTAFRQWCMARGEKFEPIWASICDIVVKTVLSVERTVFAQMAHLCARNRNACFELFGFDMLVDAHRRVHLIEVNIMPSLNTQSPIDAKIKGNLVADVLTLIGVTPFDRAAWKQPADKRAGLVATLADQLSRDAARGETAQPPRWATSKVLAGMTAEELLSIVETEEEHARRGHFQRIFPCAHTYPYYASFFEQERPLNRVAYVWEREKIRAWKDFEAGVDGPQRGDSTPGRADLARPTSTPHQPEGRRPTQPEAARPTSTPAQGTSASAAPRGSRGSSQSGCQRQTTSGQGRRMMRLA
eukprot:TRINITY_DN12352_c0_g1_i1.p1 TRINITY_DN12352_c0_g1~~TRINITY_DN12352_c0_g1_i1.p1  ORF type:complete len:832 (+),score=207.44 TRINITY_DN12352_c0_g1_i1:51-2498(+)